MKYKAYTLRNFGEISDKLDFNEEHIDHMKAVAHVLPFKTNNYVINELIDWENVPDDPIFRLTFPQKGMLELHHYTKIAAKLQETSDPHEINVVANEIRMDLNPHPAGQMEKNVPLFGGEKLMGMQHKYDQTVLFFPQNGQTCHAYCSFCFRWPQFTNINKKFAMKQVDLLIDYVRDHPKVTDILITGGDPMVMCPRRRQSRETTRYAGLPLRVRRRAPLPQ